MKPHNAGSNIQTLNNKGNKGFLNFFLIICQGIVSLCIYLTCRRKRDRPIATFDDPHGITF